MRWTSSKTYSRNSYFSGGRRFPGGSHLPILAPHPHFMSTIIHAHSRTHSCLYSPHMILPNIWLRFMLAHHTSDTNHFDIYSDRSESLLDMRIMLWSCHDLPFTSATSIISPIHVMFWRVSLISMARSITANHPQHHITHMMPSILMPHSQSNHKHAHSTIHHLL